MNKENAILGVLCLTGGWILIVAVLIIAGLKIGLSRSNLNNHRNWPTEPAPDLPGSPAVKLEDGENLLAWCDVNFSPSWLFEKIFVKKMWLTNKRVILVRYPLTGGRQCRSIPLGEIESVEIAEPEPYVKLSLKSGEVYQICQICHRHVQGGEKENTITEFFKSPPR